MARPDTAKPAPAAAGQPASKSEQLRGQLDPQQHTQVLADRQAPDDSGESDFDFLACFSALDLGMRGAEPLIPNWDWRVKSADSQLRSTAMEVEEELALREFICEDLVE